jgi:uncharacterized protein YjbJ (UPF0337 family)
MSNTSDKVSGKAKQVIGKATNNKKLEAKGKVQETSGNVKSKLKDAGKKLNSKLGK